MERTKIEWQPEGKNETHHCFRRINGDKFDMLYFAIGGHDGTMQRGRGSSDVAPPIPGKCRAPSCNPQITLKS